MAFLLRVYSFAFHMTLGVFLLTLAAIAYRTHRPLALEVMPFADEDLLQGTALVGGTAILCSLLALTKAFRFVFVIWTAGFAFLLVRGFFLGPDAFQGADQLKGAPWLTFGAIGAFFGAAWSLRMRRRGSFL